MSARRIVWSAPLTKRRLSELVERVGEAVERSCAGKVHAFEVD